MKRAISCVLLLTMFLALPLVSSAAFEPRTSKCEAPKDMTGTPGQLPKETIPSVYKEGSLLSIDQSWMAYAGVTDASELTVVKRSQRADAEADWCYVDLSAILLEGNTVLCLEGGWDSDNNILEIYIDNEPVFIYYFDPPVSDHDFVNRYGGPMLLLDDGTLLILDAYGALYACETDGSNLRKVTDTAISDFVYYDGKIYFANLDDPAQYPDVYCKTDNEYNDLYYPKLYRMNLDGSGLEKLTDCGVWGLSSQGHIILYQNIDEAFVFSIPENSGPYILSGPLYRYDAATGEHRSLGIESNQYIPTPYGLAVWYNEFRIEPYDVSRADLVLHDYDGKPLYKLDAGVAELFGQSCVADQNIEFHSYNLYPMLLWNAGIIDDTYDEDDDSEDVFTTVPLDGTKRIGGIKDIPLKSQYGEDDLSDYGDYDIYD